MKISRAEAEKAIRKLPASDFTRELHNGDIEASRNMLELDGWHIVGWAYFRDVVLYTPPEINFKYVCMFRRDQTGAISWLPFSDATFRILALKIKHEKMTHTVGALSFAC